MIGFFFILIGVAAHLFSVRGSLYLVGAGTVVTGWSGRDWVYEEKQRGDM